LSPDQNASVAKQGLSGPQPHPTAFGRQEGHRRLRGRAERQQLHQHQQDLARDPTRDLQDLVEKGALIKIGELRHTRYFLNINERSES